MTVSTELSLAPAPAERTPWWLNATVWIVAFGVGTAAYASSVTVAERTEALPSVFLEVALWTFALLALVMRHPHKQLRMSEPSLIVLGWMFYYFIQPTLTWLKGMRFAFEGTSTVILDVDLVVRVQYMHSLFLALFFITYLMIAPSMAARATSRPEAPARLPSVWPLIAFGLLPYVMNVIERVSTTGSILPTQSYGDHTFAARDALLESRTQGGAGYALTQIMSKFWYYHLMSLGLGYGVVLARLLRANRWRMILLFFAQIPVLLVLGVGARSYTILPFLTAVMVADVLAGPFRWRYFLPVVAVGVPFMNFYGVLRGYQDRGIATALDDAQTNILASANTVNTEDSGMLIKEAFCLTYADHTQNFRGVDYFIENFLQIFPMQLVPEKKNFFSTANFLSDELLGRAAARGGGMAGTTVGDGYMLGGELGVGLLAVVLGASFALPMRVGASGRPGPVMWRYMLALLFATHGVQYVRADLNVALIALLYYVLIPTIVIQFLKGGAIPTDSFWMQRLEPVRR